MILTTEEIAYVGERLNGHDIKYQEVYDELKDHLLTAIEQLRAGGDTRPVEQLLPEVIKLQFPGWWPFEDIVKEYQQAYRRKIRKALWANVRYYFNWQTAPLMLMLVGAGFYLPNTKVVSATLMIALLLMAVVLQVNVYRAGRNIHTDKGKQSLVKTYVTNRANFLVLIINVVFNLIATLAREWKPAAFLGPMHYPPVIFMALFTWFVVYGLGCIKLSRQEFKIA